MDTKGKRLFRARKKLDAPGLVSHITQRAAGSEPLFIEDSDYSYFLGLLKDISKRFAIEVYAFCLMPNHVHILIRPGKDNLFSAMQVLFSRYAMRFNRKYERKGHLFSGPYRQAVCLDDAYLLTVSLYIHLNPVKAGLTLEPLDYEWSSARSYCVKDTPDAFVNTSFILSMLDHADACAAYGALLDEGLNIEVDRVVEKENTVRVFRTLLARRLPKVFENIGQGLSNSSQSMEMLSQDELDERIEALGDLSYSSKPEGIRIKRYLIEQLLARGHKKDDVARRLGVSRRTVYNILHKEV